MSIRIFHFMAIDLFIISLFPCRAGRAADVVIPGFVAVNLGNSQTCYVAARVMDELSTGYNSPLPGLPDFLDGVCVQNILKT